MPFELFGDQRDKITNHELQRGTLFINLLKQNIIPKPHLNLIPIYHFANINDYYANRDVKGFELLHLNASNTLSVTESSLTSHTSQSYESHPESIARLLITTIRYK